MSESAYSALSEINLVNAVLFLPDECPVAVVAESAIHLTYAVNAFGPVTRPEPNALKA